MPSNVDMHDVVFVAGSGRLLDRISFHLGPGDMVAITGHSGSGKSTFVELCAGLLGPESGTVSWDGVDLAEVGRRKLLRLRSRIGFVFQQRALISAFTVFDNIALPLRYHSTLDSETIRGKVRTLMEQVGLTGVGKSFPEALSTGQLAAAALARAVVVDPDLLVADELFTGLDRQAQEVMLATIAKVRSERRIGLLAAGSDTGPLKRLGCALYRLEQGRLVRADKETTGT